MSKATAFDMGFGKTKTVKLEVPKKISLEKDSESYPEEDWLPIPNYEGLYAISDHGRIKRLSAGTNTFAGKILTPIINKKTGYPYCKLVKNGKVKKVKLHLAVAEVFLGPSPNPDFIVNHISGNKLDPQVTNLEYISRSENTKHAIRLGLQTLCYGSDNGNSKLSNEQVEEIRTLYESNNYTQQQLADKFKISRTYTNYVLNNKFRNKNI